MGECNCNKDSTWRVRAYLEYEIDACSESEAIGRLTECVIKDLEDGNDITEIADVAAEKISDQSIGK